MDDQQGAVFTIEYLAQYLIVSKSTLYMLAKKARVPGQKVARQHEESRGWVVESVEEENRGFDPISRRPHPEYPKTFIEVRFIEVKGRAGVGIVALSENEYRTAKRLNEDCWLYAVFNCAGTPQLHTVQNPARLV